MVNKSSLGSASLRRYHRGMVLRLIAAKHCSRSEIAHRSGLSSMGVTRVVAELIGAGLVLEAGKQAGSEGPGRHGTRLKLNPDGAFVIGVTISGFQNELVCVDSSGKIRFRTGLKFPEVTDHEAVITSVAAAIGRLLATGQFPRDRILGCGVAISGIVDQQRGVVRFSGPLGWTEVDFADQLRARTGLEVVVENLANALSLSEQQFGVAQGCNDVFLISAGTTLGASLTTGGALLRGATARVGQIGHTHVGAGRLTCSCGRNDCLNTVASGWSVLVNSGRLPDSRFDATQTPGYVQALSDLLGAPATPRTDELLRTAGRHTARAAAEVCLFTDPALVVIVGVMTGSAAFTEGFQSEWDRSRLHSMSGGAPALAFDPAPPAGSSAHLALNEYLFSSALSLSELINKNGSAANG